MSETRYTSTHEWVRLEGEIAIVGITAHAAEELGDLVFVEGKDNGTIVKVGESVAVVESVKAASDIYAPTSGEICDFNTDLSDKPELVNTDPQGKGWIVKLKISNPEDIANLLSEEEYKAL